MSEKGISVIMPVYCAEKYVGEAVKSILNQTLQDFELLVIDDKGEDSSMDIVHAFHDSRIRVLENDCNRGIAYATNVGLRHAKGKYIALMDDDDIAMKNRLQLEYDYLESHPDIDVVGGGDISIDESGKIISYRREVICNPKRIKAELLFRDRIHNATSMYRREFVEKNNLFYREGFLGMQDYKFWTECAACGQLANIDRVLSKWRRHGANTTLKAREKHRAERVEKIAEIQKESLKMQGFVLDDREQALFCEVFDEEGTSALPLERLLEVQKVLMKIIAQAQDKNDDNIKELKYVCKNSWADRMKRCDIWE
ncbi:MAG: glycosyltransferase [Clostridiales bacterium]|nr:glycosyltransferase [Clostridiales bacterium]